MENMKNEVVTTNNTKVTKTNNTKINKLYADFMKSCENIDYIAVKNNLRCEVAKLGFNMNGKSRNNEPKPNDMYLRTDGGNQFQLFVGNTKDGKRITTFNVRFTAKSVDSLKPMFESKFDDFYMTKCNDNARVVVSNKIPFTIDNFKWSLEHINKY